MTIDEISDVEIKDILYDCNRPEIFDYMNR